MDENTIMMIVWLCVFIVALIAELSTEAIVSAWFCVGAALALAVTYIPGMPWWGELIVFFVVSVLALIAFRPLVLKRMERIRHRTNIDTIIGKRGKVTRSIRALEFGEVRIDGVLWTAALMPNSDDIPEEKIIEVVSIEGNKLYVKEVK